MRSISFFIRHIKQQASSFFTREDVLYILVITLVGTGAFGLGRLSMSESQRPEIRIEYEDMNQRLPAASSQRMSNQEGNEPANPSTSQIVVGSVNSDVYHYEWCSGAQRISEENKVIFNSIKEAKAAGYRPAQNCEGLE